MKYKVDAITGVDFDDLTIEAGATVSLERGRLKFKGDTILVARSEILSIDIYPVEEELPCPKPE